MILIQTKFFKVFIVSAVLRLQYMVHEILFPMMNGLYCNIRTLEVCAQCPLWLCSVVPWCHALQLCGRDIF